MRRAFLIASLPLLVATTDAAAQGEDHTVTISATVGGKSYQTGGLGNCKHFGYNADFPIWMAHYSDPETGTVRLDLTYGKNKGSKDRLSLVMATGTASHEINTLMPGAGTGSATVHPAGKGGRIVVKGKDAEGVTIELTVKCATFQEIQG